MRLGLRRRSPPATAAPRVVEVITPRTNLAALSSAENLLAALAMSEPFALEIAADHNRRQFLVRAPTVTMDQQLHSQLGAAYPQAELRPLEADADPAQRAADEQVASCALELRAATYLPVRTFSDLDLDGERSAQADPVLGILSALGDLPPGWRGLSQLVLRPAREDWCRDFTRRAVQHPLEHERSPQAAASPAPMLAFMSLCLALVSVGLQGVSWLRAGQWLGTVGLIVGAGLLSVGALLFVRRVMRATVYDMQLVAEKVARPAYQAEIRLSVFAPSGVNRSTLLRQLERVSAAYRRYNLAAGNGFIARQRAPQPQGLTGCRPIWSRRRQPILTTRELAGLWHLPHAAADVALLERTTARRWLPLPASVAEGCRIGVSVCQGREVSVSIPPDVLNRHLLLVAKTRRGKSTLMLRLAEYAMRFEPRRAVLLLDPHADLASTASTLVPRERLADAVFLDVADQHQPFGLNLLDVGLGWDRDRAVNNTLTVFQREWGDRYWGPRMEDAFRFALLSLFEANVALCAADPGGGRAAQHTLLEVPTILADAAFRHQVLSAVTDPNVRAWWSDYFEPLDRRLQQEVVNPVLSKIHRFQGSRAARFIVGQPASTIDPGAWLRDGRIVIVNTARGTVGDNAAALIGSTLLNLVSLAVAEQARLDRAQRARIAMFVDEFHTIPGADYEVILAELAKYGANLVLATQSLARLLALGREDGRGLRATVFANVDGLFAFNCSAEDAEYLVPELGGAVDAQDLVELGEHQCYARLSSGGVRLPTFSVRLDPPLVGDLQDGALIARRSAERYGRNAELVEADRQSALARVLQARAAARDSAAAAATSSAQGAQLHRRNEHRPKKNQRVPEVAPQNL